MKQFSSSIAFDPIPAKSIVLCCSDGRTRAQVCEFIENMGIQADIYAIPGGPLAFAGLVETYLDGSVAEKRLKYLASEHDTKEIILVAHGCIEESKQCSMSKSLFPHCTSSERMNKVKATVIQAAERIQAATNLPIQCYFANVVGDIVQFEEIARP